MDDLNFSYLYKGFGEIQISMFDSLEKSITGKESDYSAVPNYQNVNFAQIIFNFEML